MKVVSMFSRLPLLPGVEILSTPTAVGSRVNISTSWPSQVG